jgi:RHH-type proline utilization regulon transcriptional repressor/proline dehydrogenase/delta 1-pyrroline-5-carboxylate dehydrogenase
MRMAESKVGARALGLAAVGGVRHMAHRFIVGETPRDAVRLLRDLWNDGVAASVDLLGEATSPSRRPTATAERCATPCDAARSHRPAGPRDRARARFVGPLPRVNLSVKVSALTPLLRPRRPSRRARRGRPASPADGAGAELGAHLHIDMESLDSREAVLELRARPAGRDRFGRARRRHRAPGLPA